MSAHPELLDPSSMRHLDRDPEPKVEDTDADHDDSKPNKKKRRVAKMLDKKYECKAEGCTKS
jgi:hypothetical protein